MLVHIMDAFFFEEKNERICRDESQTQTNEIYW